MSLKHVMRHFHFPISSLLIITHLYFLNNIHITQSEITCTIYIIIYMLFEGKNQHVLKECLRICYSMSHIFLFFSFSFFRIVSKHVLYVSVWVDSFILVFSLLFIFSLLTWIFPFALDYI